MSLKSQLSVEEQKLYLNRGYQEAYVKFNDVSTGLLVATSVPPVIPLCGKVHIGTPPISCGFRMMWNIGLLVNRDALASLVFYSSKVNEVSRGVFCSGIEAILDGWQAAGTVQNEFKMNRGLTYLLSSRAAIIDAIVKLIEDNKLGTVTVSHEIVNPNTLNKIKGIFWTWNGNIIPYKDFAPADYPYNEDGSKK